MLNSGKWISIIASILFCILLIGCEKKPQYDCATCKDRGYINCPNCTAQECTYSGCIDGAIEKDACDNCDGRGYTTYDYCKECGYDGYNDFGNKCYKCKGSGKIYNECRHCNGDGKISKSCPKCIGGYIDGEKPCKKNGCTTSSYSNNGRSYVDCPNCDKK